MTERVPSFYLLVPGPWRAPAEIIGALGAHGIHGEPGQPTGIEPGVVRVDIIEDGELASACSWGRRGPLPDALLSHVARCGRAALLECGFRLQEQPRLVAKIGRSLRDAGGVLVRMEASGSASEWEPWLEALESGDPTHLYEVAVLLVRDDDGVMFTCGMHHFELPDAQIAMGDPVEAMAWLDAFCVYQLAEQPTLVSGHTFRPHEHAPPRALERWPDHRHRTDDGRHNPFGVWRFLAPGDSGLQASALVSVLVPALAAVLLAAERTKGTPLTRDEVENIRDNASAIAMTPTDAAKLEQSRGYADIEPERAWEQWQLLRRPGA